MQSGTGADWRASLASCTSGASPGLSMVSPSRRCSASELIRSSFRARWGSSDIVHVVGPQPPVLEFAQHGEKMQAFSARIVLVGRISAVGSLKIR